MPAPTFRAAGTSAAGTSGAVSPGIPAGVVAGDLLFLCAEGSNTDFGTDPTGYTPLYEGSGVSSKLKVWTRIASGTGADAATITPTAGDHTYARIYAWQDPNVAVPCVILGSSEFPGAGAVTGCTIPGGQCLFDDCAYFGIGAYTADTADLATSAQSNADVTGLTDQGHLGTALGNGGGLVVYSGSITAGKVRSTTFTAGTATGITGLALALPPKAAIALSSKSVTIAGVAAPDGGNVRFLDLTQPAASCLVGVVTTAAGVYSALVPYDDHNYQAVFENGANYGASSVHLAV